MTNPDGGTDGDGASAFQQSLALLRTRRYGTFLVATLLSNLGTWAQQVAEPWLLLSLGASPFVLGLDAFAQSAPAWLLTLPGGLLADRADRRRVIAVCQCIQALCPTALIVLLLTGLVAPWMVILASCVVGVTDALSMPSFQSIVPSIVERPQIPSALALNATQFNTSRILGPAVAGVLMAGFGMAACFAANAVSYLPFMGVALWMLPRAGRRPAAAADADEDQSLLAGALRRIMRQPLLRQGLLTVLTTSFLCAPLVTFCPVLVRDVFQAGAAHFSLALGAFGLGGLLGAVALLGIAPQRDRRPFGSGFAVLFGLATVLAAADPWPALLPAVLGLAGLGMSVSNTSVNTLIQTHAPEDLRGRTISLYMLAMRGGLSLGSLLTGASIQGLGIRGALLLNGCCAIVLHGLIWLSWRRIPAPTQA